MATILFTDLVGSTALRVALGEERADELRRVHDDLLGGVVAAHGGRVVKGGGDGLLAAFDSASAALGAAVAMQQALASYNRRSDRVAELSVRIGLSAGDVSWEDGDCFGTPVVEAARLETSAQGGQILCSDLVRLMARGRGGHDFVAVGEVELKGLPEPVVTYEVVWEPPPVDDALPPWHIALPAGLAVGGPDTFVGRTNELERVRSLVADTGRAAPSVVWLAGEPGIGKTRLATEVARQLHSVGWTVLFGRCDEALQVPYQPFAEALRQLCGQLDDAALQEVFSGVLGRELSHLCPELARRLGFEDDRANPDLDQYRLFDAMRALLANLAGRGPVLYVVDDVHWATAPTLLLVNYLARNLETGKVAVVATLRDTECPEALRAIIDESILRPGGAEVALGGLGRAEVALLAGAEVAEELFAQTAGNPLFVRAVAAAGSGEISFDATIRRRVSRLDDRAGSLLRLASLAGLEFDLRIVARAAQADPIDALGHLEAAVRAGLLEESGSRRFRFAHGLVRDVLAGETGAARRVFGHRSLAEAYDAIQPDDLAAVARHWSEAADDPASIARAVAALIAAGDTAHAASDHDGAARAYGRGLELIGTEPTVERAQLALGFGRARFDGGSYSEATETILLEAAAIAEQVDADAIRVDALAWAAMVVGNVVGHASRGASDAIRRMLDHKPRDGVLAVRATALGAFWVHGGKPDAVQIAEDALALAEELDDPWALGWAHNAVFEALPYARARDRAIHARASFSHLEPVVRDSLSLYWRNHLVSALLSLGDLNEMHVELRVLRAEVERRRDPFLRHVLVAGMATLALLRGDFGEAEQLAVEGDALAGAIDGPDLSGLHGTQMFSIRREQGRLGEIAPAMRLVARLDQSGAWRPGLAAIYADLNMLSEANEELQRLIVGDVLDLPDDGSLPLSASYLADAATAVGNVGAARVLYDVMKPWSGLTVTSFLVACYGPVDRYLGMLALTMGDGTRAAEHLHAALDQCRVMGSPTYEAHTLYWLSRLALAGDDRSGWQRWSADARAVAERLGMAGLVARLDGLPEVAVR